jgi:hypothetical protein
MHKCDHTMMAAGITLTPEQTPMTKMTLNDQE